MSGFHIGFGANSGSAADALSAVQSVRTAAAQQQKLQQQQAQQQFSDELEMRKAGYTPLEQMTPAPRNASGAPTGFARRTQQPNIDPSRIITDPYGQKWVAADPNSKALTPEQQQTQARQGQTDLRDALEKHGESVQNGTIYTPGGAQAEQDAQATLRSAHQPVPDQSRVISAGGKQVYMPTDEENAAAELKTKTAQADALRHLSEFPIPDDLAAKLGLDTSSGNGATFHDLATAHHELMGPAKEEKDAPAHITTSTDDAGNVTITRTDPDTGKEMWTRTVKGVGAKKKDPDAAPAPKPTTAQLHAIVAKKGSGLRQAEAEYAKTMQSVQQRMLRLQQQPAVSDAQKAGRQAAMATLDSEKSAAADTLQKAKQGTQDEYEEGLNGLGYPVEHFDYSGQAQAPAGGPPQRAQQTAAAAQGGRGGQTKSVTLDQVRAWGAAQNPPLSDGEAMKRAIGEGFTVTRPKPGN